MASARVVLAGWLLVLVGFARAAADDQARILLGPIEPVAIPALGLVLDARVDTGAATSSLDSRNIRLGGPRAARTVDFVLVETGGRRTSLTLPLVEMRSVRSATGRPEKRPVVQLEVCLAGRRLRADFTLTDRSHMEYRMLLGRQVLEEGFVVDVARTARSVPACPESQ